MRASLLFGEDGRRDRPTPVRTPDFLSEALGERVFDESHRFPGLAMTRRVGAGPRLAVSRFYWRATPPVAVDFRDDLRFGAEEARLKEEFFRGRGIRYFCLRDRWDVDGLRPVQEEEPEVAPVRLPSVGPRRRG